jgi:SAM-dependent methyltransferase
LAAELGSEGSVVGIDGSDVMITHARSRAADALCPMRFAVGDAMSLDEPARTFDAVRSERMLQWVPDPALAVAEMARVVRPGGRVSLIDTDWSTYTIDVDNPELSERVRATYGVERNRRSLVGAHLADLARAAGLEPTADTSATQVWSKWDPDNTPRLDGWVTMHDLADDLIGAGQLDARERDEFVTTIHDAARAGRFTMRLTMYAILAIAPQR